MRSLISDWSLSALVLFVVVKALQFLKWLGFRPTVDGWRRATHAYLRTEHSKFALSAFRLRGKASGHGGPPEMEVSKRLLEFMEKEPRLQWRVDCHRFATVETRTSSVFLSIARFTGDGEIESLQPVCLSMSDQQQGAIDAVLSAVTASYNATRHIRDKRRPRALWRRIRRQLRCGPQLCAASLAGAEHLADRILSGALIHFEQLQGNAERVSESRLCPPDFTTSKHPASGLMNIRCRHAADWSELDLWFQFHHVPVDGLPMQEVIESLKREWGVADELVLPAAVPRTKPLCCTTSPGRDPICHSSQLIRSSSFLQARRELNHKHAQHCGGDITLVSMLAWGMAHHPSLSRVKFSCPIDLPQTGERGRTLGFVFIRPCVYLSGTGGFVKYQREFNRQLRNTRGRQGESYEVVELFALNTPAIYSATRALLPRGLAAITGTVGLTMIRGADMFLAPMSDIHTDGFLAFGNLSLPVEGGGKGGLVSAKAPRSRLAQYLDAVEDTTADFMAYV